MSRSTALSLHVEKCDVYPITGCPGRSGESCERIWRSGHHRATRPLFIPSAPSVETSLEDWNRCMMVNVGSIYLLGHFGIPEMKKRGGGSIINLASVQGHACQRGVAAYAASKGAVHSLTRALALDHAADQHPGKFDQSGIDPHAYARTLSGTFFAGRVGRRGIQALRRRSSPGADRYAGRSRGTGCVSRLRQGGILHWWRLPGGRRTAGRHRGSVISSRADPSQPICVAPTGDVCGEGAVWHAAHSAVYWTDINRFLIHRFTLADQCVRTWFFDEPVTALIAHRPR